MAKARVTPIAVIGMSCRLPGGIDSPDRLWEALLRGDDLITEIPADRWNADDYYDPEPGVPGRSVSRWGGFLDDIAGFDPEFFGIGEREATAMDPQHRLLLQTAWEAVEHGGLAPASLNGSLTGVFVGLAHSDYSFVTGQADALEDPYGFTGLPFSMGSGRISYAMGLRGPALTVDTACSSSLLAVHMACRSLDDGESDLALAGGCMVMMEPQLYASASALGMLSPSGRCRAFDAAADGFVRSEGCAVVLLKRLPDALRDGDPIRAVLRGTATNQDGRTENISTPSVEAQVVAYRAALATAGFDARDASTVGMVEAHGTGTPVGDPIEFASLAQVYGIDRPCALASAKSNLGHPEAAAGIVGLVKAVLSLQHGVVPPMVHFTQLPDELAQIDTNLFVPQEVTLWPGQSGALRRAAVSSYGMSGSNVHAILEQAPAQAPAPANGARPTKYLFPLSATSPTALHQTSRRVADWLDERADSRPVALPDLAHTLARRRGHRPVRTAVVAASTAELVDALREVAADEVPFPAAVGQDDRGPVWVFSGQGSQWAGMGADLLADEPVFAATVAAVEPLVARECGFSVTEAMTTAQPATEIDRVQPTLFAMQVALAAALKSHGVRPGAVIGHSLGEVAAAVVAGALSLDDGVRVICRRSRLCTRIAGMGAMASVELPVARVREELASRGIKDVVVAVVASPQSTVIGGGTATVRDLVAAWEARDVMAREVAVDVASHTPQVDPILGELAEALADIAPITPEIPYYSTTLFDPRDRPEFDPRYWSDNLRHMVRFGSAVRAALEDGHRVFGELSPHPLLTRAVQQAAADLDIPVAAVAAMRRDQPLPHGLLGLVSELHSAGAAVDFAPLCPDGQLVDAPLAAWANRRLLLTPDSPTPHTANSVAAHPLLGPHVRLMEEPERHAWHGTVGTAALPWLRDHQIHNVAALPGAAYCEMAVAAAQRVLGEASEVRDIRFEEMLLLDDDTDVGTVASVEAPGAASFLVQTDRNGEKVVRATATLHEAADGDRPPAHDVAALLSAYARRLDGDELRGWFDDRGVQFGPAFTGLAAAHVPEGTVSAVLAEVGLPGAIRTQQASYGVHPALLDACFQSVAAHPAVQGVGNAGNGIAQGGLLLPLGVRQLRAYASTRNARYCLTRVTACGAHVEADIDLMDEHGSVLLVVRGLLMGTGASETADRDRLLSGRLLTIEWQRRSLPPDASADAGSWLLVGLSDDTGASELGDALERRGAHCVTMCWPAGAEAKRLRDHLDSGECTGVVALAPPPSGDASLPGSDHVRQFVRLARELAGVSGETRLYLVSRSAQAVLGGDTINLEQGGLRGLLRVIGAEHPHLRATHIDVDERTDATHVADQLLSGTEEDETAWRDGEWFVARLCPAPLRPDERHTAVVDHERDGVRLQVRTPGDLQTMELATAARVPPGPGQIEVAVSASSINFADVLVAFGRYPAFEGLVPQLGTDFAGVVTAVGPPTGAVTDHRVGDRVGGISPSGCWGSFVTCDARLATTIPSALTEAQAAAVTTAHATAWYGLHQLARMKAGDKVLIHSATGGVGQAAIAMARAAGAQIFATAGSPQRRELLRDMGVEHVYDSRSVEFADHIRRDTDGYGVDIVLNSLTGAAQRAGIGLLSLGGRFVEIGKRDIYGDTRLGLFPFRRNLAFYAVDLGLMAVSHPDHIRELLTGVYRMTADATLPMPELTRFPLAQAATAIRMMSAAEHTGKLVLDVPRAGRSRVVMPPEQAPVFRRDGSYIITGGLGGLGLFLAENMAAAGAGRIVLSSRSAPSQKVLETIEFVRATGSDVVVECGDIARPETAKRLMAAASATGLPLRGVLHAAAVVEDATLTNITDELVERDWAPKVYGAWQLHQALREVEADQPLDWFCSFSSAAALLGSPGQGAYAAANSWLDAFTHWRRAQGLAATAIAWGAWADIGRGAGLADGGATAMITPDEGGYAFEALLRHNRAYSGYAPVSGSPWLTSLAGRSRFAEAFRSRHTDRSDSGKFRAELAELPEDEWPSRLRRLVSEQVGLILRRTVDPDRPLSEYGLDSLGNLELRTRIETETGIRSSSTDITTVRDFADHLCRKLALIENDPVTT